MKLLQIVSFRHKQLNLETAELESVFLEYPQILTSVNGISYITALVKKAPENGIEFGGKPRRLYIFENEHPYIFHAIEEGQDVLIPGDIVTCKVPPYEIEGRIFTHKTVAVIGNNENEINFAINRALAYQEQRL